MHKPSITENTIICKHTTVILYPCSNFIAQYVFAVGHGKSEGDRVHIDTFKIYFDDVIHHVEDTIAAYPDVPCFLMGHSNVSEH